SFGCSIGLHSWSASPQNASLTMFLPSSIVTSACRAISTSKRLREGQHRKTINQVRLILGAAKQLHHRLFVRKNRSDSRQLLFCLAACVVEQDRVHARTQRSHSGFLAP